MQEFSSTGIKEMIVPRGTPGLAPFRLDMTEVYRAEDRLDEVKTANQMTSIELRAYFNQICNLTTKYIAWVKYEILQAEKNYKLAKAEVLLDKSIEEFKKYKEAGMKFNDDFREALIIRDEKCNNLQEAINMLKAVQALLEAKADTFVRAYYTCGSVAESRSGARGVAASPNLSVMPEQPVDPAFADFMGISGHTKR